MIEISESSPKGVLRKLSQVSSKSPVSISVSDGTVSDDNMESLLNALQAKEFLLTSITFNKNCNNFDSFHEKNRADYVNYCVDSSCFLGLRGVYLLSKSPLVEALTSLAITRNYLDDIKALTLARGLPRMHVLASLDLSHNGITDDAGVEVVRAMPVSLIELNLAQNSIANRTVHALVDVLEERNQRLVGLALGASVTGKGAVALGEAAKLDQLRRFSLTGHRCGQEGVDGLCRGLRRWTRLEELYFAGFDYNMQQLVDALPAHCIKVHFEDIARPGSITFDHKGSTL